MKHLLTGIAAIALAAGGALAQGNGHGNAHGNGKPKAEHAQTIKSERGEAKGAAMRADKRDDRPAKSAADDRRGGPAHKADKGERGNAVAQRGDERGGKAERRMDDRPVKAQVRSDDERRWSDREYRRGGRVLEDGRRIFETADASRWWDDDGRRGLIDGCPPGLAKKNNGCMPPGLAKKDDRSPYRSYRPDWWGLGSLGLGDGRYHYEDGYLMRLVGDRVAGYIPLLGGALSVGNPWPSYYDPRPVPPYLVDYFGLGPQEGYRYADDVLYRVDPETAAITSIVALLTGNDIRVGQPMPPGYDVYNVPYSYRSQYRDGPDSLYRYSDGYIYQVDPKTRLVAAAIELLAR